MNWPNLREASTKRGLVWIVGGCWILVQALRGQSVNPDELFDKLDFWLGVIMTASGALGLLPDEPKQVFKVELPPLDVQARPEPRNAGAGSQPVRPANGVRPPLPAQDSTRKYQSADPNTYPRFGSGFGDRD